MHSPKPKSMATTLNSAVYGIKEVLGTLGIKEENYGASTGLKFLPTKGKKN